MTELRVDPGALRCAGPAVDRLGDAVTAVLSRLRAALDAEGACWGHDHIGHTFGDAYRPAQQQVCDALRHTAERLSGLGDAVLVVAEAAAAADARAEQRLV